MTQEVVPQITVSSVLQDLKDGLTREAIAVKYHLPKSEVKNMFQHPLLKNKKTITPKQPRFILIDDVTNQAAAEQVAEQEEAEVEAIEADDASEESVEEQVEQQVTESQRGQWE